MIINLLPLKTYIMIPKLFTIVILLLVQTLVAQSILGTWYGNLNTPGQILPLVFHVEQDGTLFKTFFDSPMQGAKGIPAKSTTFENSELTVMAPEFGITYKGTLSAEKIEGIFTQGESKTPFTLTRINTAPVVDRPQNPKLPYPYNSTEVTFKNETQGNELAGTIAEPKNFDKNTPILVMITGSGVQNRDEEMDGHKPFLVISDDLAKKGIATLRLDDRGIGGSEKGKEEQPTTADFVTDINSAVNYLMKNGYTNIGLIGHSEGGMIAPMVASENKNVKFIVLLAGPALPMIDVFVNQARSRLESVNVPKEDIDKDVANKRMIFQFVKSYMGKDYKADLKKYLADNFPNMKSQETDGYVRQLGTNWWRYSLNINPQLYLEKLKIPVLAVNGSKDTQVNPKENLASIKKSLEKAGNKKFEIVEFDGLNHFFQTAETGSSMEYPEITETISPKVLDKVSSWIANLK